MSEHNWSDWPETYCLKCGAVDPVEQAIADRWLDPLNGVWDSPEHEQIVIERNKCPVDDIATLTVTNS